MNTSQNQLLLVIGALMMVGGGNAADQPRTSPIANATNQFVTRHEQLAAPPEFRSEHECRRMNCARPKINVPIFQGRGFTRP